MLTYCQTMSLSNNNILPTFLFLKKEYLSKRDEIDKFDNTKQENDVGLERRHWWKYLCLSKHWEPNNLSENLGYIKYFQRLNARYLESVL